jgi:hypothetical protein
MEMCWSVPQKRRFVVERPDLVSARAPIQPPTSYARIDADQAAIQRPRKNTRKHRPGVVRLTSRFLRKPIAPGHELSSRAAIRQRAQWEVAKLKLNPLDLTDVVGARPRLPPAEVLASLKPLKE